LLETNSNQVVNIALDYGAFEPRVAWFYLEDTAPKKPNAFFKFQIMCSLFAQLLDIDCAVAVAQ